MKPLIFTIGIAITLSLGGVLLYAKPHQAPSSLNPRSEPATKSGWLTYRNADLGFSINYPNDSTYTVMVAVSQGKLPHSMYPVEAPAPFGSLVTIGQPNTLFTTNTIANRELFQIYVTPDSSIPTSMPVGLQVSSTTLINGLLFQKLTTNPEVSGNTIIRDYAYAIQHNDRYYVFQSSRGPDDLVFEQMMASLEFD